MKALLDWHGTVLDNVEGEDGITVRKNWKGGLTIGGGGGSMSATSSKAFQASATPTAEDTWADPSVPEYTVVLLNGTAQVFGGDPFSLCTPPALSYSVPTPVPEGSFVCLQYSAFDPETFVEIGTWALVVLAALPEAGTAPATLTYPICQIGSEFLNSVNQMHEGNVVMPAISNVVDTQSQVVQIEET